MVHASFVVSVEDIFLNSLLVTALNKAFNALLLKLAALIFASSQSAGASFGLVQPISTAATPSHLRTVGKLSCVLSNMHS